MKTVSFAIQKGGTGKTSISVSVAAMLAHMGYSTLLIDADPQGNATGWICPTIAYEFADVLFHRQAIEDVFVNAHIPRLQVLPTAGLDGELRLYAETKAQQEPFAIRQLLTGLESKMFDFVVIDTSPAFGPLEKQCFLASDEVLAVLQLDIFSADGLYTFAHSIEGLKKTFESAKPTFNKLILNVRDARLQQQDVILQQFATRSDYEQFLVPVDQAFKKAQGSTLFLHEWEGVKKETIEAIQAIAQAITGRK